MPPGLYFVRQNGNKIYSPSPPPQWFPNTHPFIFYGRVEKNNEPIGISIEEPWESITKAPIGSAKSNFLSIYQSETSLLFCVCVCVGASGRIFFPLQCLPVCLCCVTPTDTSLFFSVWFNLSPLVVHTPCMDDAHSTSGSIPELKLVKFISPAGQE